MYVLLFEIPIKDLDNILIIMYQELEFYKQYHSNTINRIIHFFVYHFIFLIIKKMKWYTKSNFQIL